MPLDTSIPLSVRPYEAPSPIQTIGSLMQLRSMGADLALKQAEQRRVDQQAEAERAIQTQKNRDLADENTIQQYELNSDSAKKLGAGDFSEIQGKIQPSSLNRYRLNHQTLLDKQLANDTNTLKLNTQKHEMIEQGIVGLKGLADPAKIVGEYPAWVQRLRADKVIAGDNPLFPDAIADPAELDKILATNNLFYGASQKALAQKKTEGDIAHVAAQADQATATAGKLRAETPGATAEAEMKVRQSAAARLAGASTPEQYAASLDELPHGIARQFPTAEQWSPTSRSAILRAGMSPAEIATADTADKNAENNVSEFELELRAAKGDTAARAALQSATQRKMQVAAAGREASGIAGRNLDHEIGQYGKPYQEMVKGVDAQLDKILDAEKMIAGGAVSQALGVPKILTALVSGQGSGVRITQAELNSILHARGFVGDVEGFFSKLSGNGSLTAEQKQQMQSILSDVRERIVQKKMIANGVLDEMNGARNRDEILAAEKKGRAALEAHADRGGGQQYVRLADGPNGHQIGQKSDGGWYDVQTGGKVR